MARYRCVECDRECELITHHWREPCEFWGAPGLKDEYEDVSECCNAEYEEMDDDGT